MQSDGPSWGLRAIRLLLLALSVTAVSPTPARGQAARAAAAPATGIVEGVVTTQGGTIRLAGALVTLRQNATDVTSAGTDADGHYRFADLAPGTYQLVVALDGFDTKTAQVTVVAGRSADASLDLPIAAVAERVEVSA